MGDRADVKVGFACNNRCVFCAQGDKRADIGFVPRAELYRRLEAAQRPGRGLVLTGGEPTIRRDLVAVVARAWALGFRPIQIQTNGRMLAYPELVRRLIAAGADEFSPALHGPSAAVHDALTCAPGSFVETCAGIRNVLSAGAVVITNTVVVRQNLAHLAATIACLADLGVRQAQLALVHPVGTAATRFDEVVPRLADAAPALGEAIDAGQRLRVKVVVEAVPLCFLRGRRHTAVEDAIPETTVVDLDGGLFRFSDWRRRDGKVKGPPCTGCGLAARCEGPWREYPERFGWDDFVPFSSS